MPTVTAMDALYSLDRLEQAAQRVYAFMDPTPQQHWPSLSQRCGCEVWVKHEDQTPVGAFKVRGGMVYFEAMLAADPAVPGVVTATRGNHGQSIGLAARHFNLPATVFVPRGNSASKNEAMRNLGVDLREEGDDFVEAIAMAKAYADESGRHFIPSFHPALVQGVASYSLEFLRAAPPLDAVYVPIGLGSGICGMIAARNALGLSTQIIGVVAEAAPAYALSFQARTPMATESADSIADGVACRAANPDALAMILDNVSHIVTVSEADILHAMAVYHADTGHKAEGAGAIGLGALLKEKEAMAHRRVGLILSGGNVDPAIHQLALDSLDVSV